MYRSGLQIVDELRLVAMGQTGAGLEFQNETGLHQEVSDKASYGLLTIRDGQGYQLLELDAFVAHLYRQRALIHTLEKARSQPAMNPQGAPNDLPRNREPVHLNSRNPPNSRNLRQ